MENNRCLVTGATGFVGRELIDCLHDGGKQVTAAVRRESIQINPKFHAVTVGDINGQTNWQGVLDQQDVVIHLANRAHVMDEDVADPLPLFRAINVAGTIALAKASIAAGVKRFVFLSSIKVNGEMTTEQPFTAADEPNPQDPYAVSKYEAEQELKALCDSSSMELVIIRPPLIYGLGVKGNLAALKKLVNKPLPLGSIDNRRDLIGLGNLIDLIRVCINRPDAAGKIFLCCDDDAVSTPELIRLMARAQGVSPRIFPFPMKLLAILAGLLGKKAQYQRLTGDLRIDMTATQATLNWSPPFTVDESMQRAFADRGCE